MIGAIENGILARLQAASDAGALGYTFATLDTYPEDWDQYFRDKGPIRAPAAWVVFAGAKALDDPQMRLSFGVVFMAENARNETATRQGGPVVAEPGSYQLVEDGMVLLVNSDLDLQIGRLQFQSIRVVSRLPALIERKVSMMALELTTDVAVGTDDLGDELNPFELFHINWDIPPHGNVDADPAEAGVQIPADATADATDDVHLEQ